MLHGLSSTFLKRRFVDSVHWVSLARAEASLKCERTRLEFAALPDDALAAYALAKSAMWDELHGLARAPTPPTLLSAGLDILGKALGERTCALHERAPFDVVHVHDFQLLESARHLPRRVPRVFRWHVPVRPLAPAVRDYVVRALDEYDAIIVSTQAYAEELRAWGVRPLVHASYPYLDESRRRVVTDADLAAFDDKHGLRSEDVVFTVVARMDPIKNHDVAIRALARVAGHCPEAKLLLVGGGGFSGGRQGLGLPQAADLRERLEAEADALGVRDRVVFTGGIEDAELDVAFTRSRAVLLPSAMEGFGLAVVEGWLYGRPALVSQGAGVAELVEEGINGHTFAPGDAAALAESMLLLARDADLARAMGAAGRQTARACHLARGAKDVWEILANTCRRAPDETLRSRRRWGA